MRKPTTIRSKAIKRYYNSLIPLYWSNLHIAKMYNENDNDESNELDDNEGRETETMVLQSVSAKDRIDECLQQLADLKTSKGRASMSRSEILNRFSQ